MSRRRNLYLNNILLGNDWLSKSKPKTSLFGLEWKRLPVYTLSEARSGVDWADLMAAQGAFGTDFYVTSTRTIVGTMLYPPNPLHSEPRTGYKLQEINRKFLVHTVVGIKWPYVISGQGENELCRGTINFPTRSYKHVIKSFHFAWKNKKITLVPGGDFVEAFDESLTLWFIELMSQLLSLIWVSRIVTKIIILTDISGPTEISIKNNIGFIMRSRSCTIRVLRPGNSKILSANMNIFQENYVNLLTI